MNIHISTKIAFAIAAGLFAIGLIFDLSTQLGVAGGVPYVLPVLIGVWFPRRRYVIAIAVIGTLLTIFGYFLSTPGIDETVVLTNRSLALIIIWLSALMVCMFHQTIKELNLSQKKMTMALSASNSGIWVRDKQLENVYWSEENYKLLGYKPGEVIASFENWKRRIHPDDREYIATCFNKSLKYMADFDLEYRLLLPDGSIRWINNRGRVMTFGDDDSPVMAGIQVDITERKQLEEKQQESEEKFLAITKSSTKVMVVAIDENGMVIAWNPGAEKSFGYSEEEIMGRPLINVIPERYRAAHQQGLQRASHSENYAILGKTVELHGLRKDGTEFPIELSLGSWKHGEKKYFSAIINDISERKLTEDRLRQGQELLDAATEHMGQGLTVFDNELKLVIANKKFWQFFDFPEELSTIGVHYEDMVRFNAERGVYGPGNVEDWVQKYLKLVSDPAPHHFEQKCPDGTVLQISGNPMPDGGFVTTYTDITERIQTVESLLTAKNDAEQASRVKTDFLASMSHELRTPLNAVLGFAQMIQIESKNPLTPAQNNYVGHILEGGNHLLKLVNELLDLAKIEADQLDLSLEEIDANSVVADCLALTMPLAEMRKIEIVNEVPDGPAILLRTDLMRLKQVLINILSNAIKYNRDGGTVTVNSRETADGFLRMSVTDTGIGIAEKDYSGLFKMFHRIGADPMKTREGTGIGLTVTKLLVERMAGRVGFESAEGVGSTFWIELPLASNQNVIIWTEALRVGVDAIDKDHQILISLLAKVTHQSVDDKGVNETIDGLIDYTLYHFRREEMIMQACGYPDLEKHRGIHRDLIRKVNDLADAWRKDSDPEMCDRLRKFLKDWLFNHIIGDDARIAPYAKGKDQLIRNLLDPLD